MEKTIRTKRLYLRPLTMEDLYTVHAYSSDLENTKYMINLPNRDMEETRAFLNMVVWYWQQEMPEWYEFAVVLDEIQIGSISLEINSDSGEAELGWIIHKAYWKQGYAFEAALAVMEFAVRERKVKRIIAHCDSRNTGSYRVMEKLGMRLERDDGIRYNKFSPEPSRELLYSVEVEELKNLTPVMIRKAVLEDAAESVV